MKFWCVFILSALCSSVGYTQQDRPAFLNLEEDDPVISVFDRPGSNWRYCEKNKKGECVGAIGWLDRDAKIWVVGSKVKAKTRDPFTGEVVEEEYYPIEFEYAREAGGRTYQKKRGPQGYIEAAYVEFKKTKGLYSTSKIQPPKECGFNANKGGKQFEDLKCHIEISSVHNAALAIKDSIGFCADLAKDTNKKSNIYDNVVLGRLKASPPPKVKGENDRYMTSQDLVDIDSLARTLYGEMASCFKHGLQYPMAVARIAVNRKEEKSQHANFIRGAHADDKPTLSKVVTSASQFSLWLRKLNGAKNPPLGMAMCPPRDPSKPMWNGVKPSKQELAIWNHTVRIATEAVLFPKSFKKRTNDLNGRYFYTSGMGQFFNMKKDSVQIEGRSLDKAQCIEVWKKSG